MELLKIRHTEGLAEALEGKLSTEDIRLSWLNIPAWRNDIDLPAGLVFRLGNTAWVTQRVIPAGTNPPPFIDNWPSYWQMLQAKPDQETLERLDGFRDAIDGKAPLNHSHNSGQIVDFAEAVQDAVAQFMRASGGVTLTYDDANNTYTISSTPGETFDPEKTRDAIGAALVPLGLIDIAINDAGDTISISTRATQNQTDAYLLSRANHTGTQALDTVEGLPAALNNKAAKADLAGYLPLAGNTPATPLGSLYWAANAAIGYVGSTLLLTSNGRTIQISESGLTIARPGVATVTLDTSEQGQLLVNGSPLSSSNDYLVRALLDAQLLVVFPAGTSTREQLLTVFQAGTYSAADILVDNGTFGGIIDRTADDGVDTSGTFTLVAGRRYEFNVAVQDNTKPVRLLLRRPAGNGSSGPAVPVRDVYDVAESIRTAVAAGTYSSGELQGQQPAGSEAGDEFTTTTYGYKFQRGAAGTLVWCRYPKG